MAQHSPGPWQFEPRVIGYELTSGDRRLRLGFFEEGPGLGHAAEANMRLIAASPALLAACRALVACDDRGLDVADRMEALHQARGAIAQAEGV